MKRQLVLIRHTKSNRTNFLDPDMERPINQGRADDPKRMSKKLKELELKPDLIICSPATRTRQTVEYFCDTLKYEFDKVKFDSRLYESSTEDYLEVLRENKAEDKTIIMVGHNPSITYFANLFILERLEHVPTTGVVWIEFDHPDWNIPLPAPSKLKYFFSPKLLAEVK